MDKNITNYLTIDVEDYFHVSAFENSIKFEKWGNYESRVVSNTRKILEILSEAGGTKETFFVLGWVPRSILRLSKKLMLTDMKSPAIVFGTDSYTT